MTYQPELDGLIVRNIGDIGAAANRAKYEIDPRLWVEAANTVVAAAFEFGWISHADAPQESVWMTHADWMQAGDDTNDPPFFLKLNERAEPGFGVEWTWLAAFTGAWPGRAKMGLFVGDERLRQGAWKKRLRNNNAAVEALIARGFRYDGPSGDLYVPFLVDAELLAQAFETDVFEAALQPLAAAVATVCAAHAELDQLYRLPTE